MRGASPTARCPDARRTRLPIPRSTLPLALLGTLLITALSGCTEDEIGSALSVELIGPDTGRVGEELSVLFNVSGRRLEGIIFTWGDGAVDSLPTAGAQTASGSRQHTYRESGRFMVRARVEDSVEGVASAEVIVNIEPGPPNQPGHPNQPGEPNQPGPPNQPSQPNRPSEPNQPLHPFQRIRPSPWSP